MSAAPTRGTVPHRQRRDHNHDHHLHRKEHQHDREELEEKRPKVNPIFLWASQCEQRIIEVRCEDYDKRNRIKLTKTAQGWRSIPRTASNTYAVAVPLCGTSEATSATPTLSTEEKENGVRRDQSRHMPVSDFERNPTQSRTDSTDRMTDMENVRERRKKYTSLMRNRKRKRSIDLSSERMSSESRINTIWKSKRRRKMEKYRRRKRVTRSEEDMDDEDDEEEEDKKKKEKNENNRHRENSNKEERHRRRPGNNAMEKLSRSNFTDLERMKMNKLLQPRVVLEQLHLSQLPKRVHLNSSSVKAQEREKENEKNKVEEKEKQTEDDDVNDEPDDQNKEENNDADDEGVADDEDEDEDDEDERIECDKKSTVMDKGDLQDLFNMLDSNNFSNSDVQPVVDSKVVAKTAAVQDDKSLKVSVSCEDSLPMSQVNRQNVNKVNSVHSEKLPDIVTSLSCFIADNNDIIYGAERETKSSKTLDNFDNTKNSTTSERKNNNASSKKLISPSSIANSSHNVNGNCLLQWQNAMTLTRVSLKSEKKESVYDKKDYSDSSSILRALQNTPGLSVSIATKPRPSENMEYLSKQGSVSSRSPDSQSGPIEQQVKSHFAETSISIENFAETNPKKLCSGQQRIPRISIAIPQYKHPSQAFNSEASSSQKSPMLKSRVDSPESTTVNCPQLDEYTNHIDTRETGDEDDCDSQVLEDIQKQNELSREQRIPKVISKDIPPLCPLDEMSIPDSPKTWYSSHSPPQISSKSNEAQAKLSNSHYQEKDEGVVENLKSRGTVVSPQPSGIPYSTILSKKSTSGYLERLLPSPPCSVSCSEDAKNDLTLKSILASPRLTTDYDKPKNQAEEATMRGDHVPSTMHPAELVSKASRTVPSDSSLYTTNRTFPKKIIPTDWTSAQYQREYNRQSEYNLWKHSLKKPLPPKQSYATSTSMDIPLDPASQLRELIKTSGHFIPDPLLVPRDYLPSLAAAPLTGIPKLLASRPELRLPEALSKPELLRDPNLLVISLAHLQHVLDHSDVSTSGVPQTQPRMEQNDEGYKVPAETKSQAKPKLSCKPIGTLMPAPMDLSNNRRLSPCPPLLRVRSGLTKQESEVTSTANSPDDMHLWHPLFGSQKRHASWHRTTLAS